LVMPQAMLELVPNHSPGTPGWPAPPASSSGPCTTYSYQLDGIQNGWCGSLHNIAWPEVVRQPATAQLLLPRLSLMPTATLSGLVFLGYGASAGRMRCSAASGVRNASRRCSGK